MSFRPGGHDPAARRPSGPDLLSSTRVTAVSLAAVVMAAMVFMVWPDLDLRVASVFALGADRFVGATPLGGTVRGLFYRAPVAILVIAIGLYALRRARLGRLPAPGGAGLVFMASSLALGPGLLVNVGLKDHWHRPRPAQVQEFGGTMPFRPFWRRDGQCDRNCSFVSGEGAAAVWTVAPALLVPLPYRPAAVGAALIFAIATGCLRMAFGGHFLSDTVFAALFTWLVILACWRLVTRLTGHPPDRPAPSGVR